MKNSIFLTGDKRSLILTLALAAALVFGAGTRRAWAQEANQTTTAAAEAAVVEAASQPVNSPPQSPAPVVEPSTGVEDARSSSPPNTGPNSRAPDANLNDLPACSLNESNALPVIFVPGTAGSELRLRKERNKDRDDLYWIGGKTLGKDNLGRAPLKEDGSDFDGNLVTAPRSLSVFALHSGLTDRLRKRGATLKEIEIYSKFLIWANDVFKGGFCEVPYDWRKGASPQSAERIARVVDDALRTSRQTKVILLAHSLGGIVARDYIQRGGGKNVAAFIAVGTPWLGTPKTARALLWGYNFGAGITIAPPLGKNDKATVYGEAEDFVGTQCEPREKGKPGYECPDPWRISFLKLKETSELARNFPAVYQQLPTEEFMEKYGTYHHQSFRSVILDMKCWTEVENFYRGLDKRKRGNDYLYVETQKLRNRILNTDRPDNYGVRNYLIAGVYSPACRMPGGKYVEGCNVDNIMDMQMAGSEKIKKSFARRLLSGSLRVLNLIVRPVGFILTRERFTLEDDRYVATDSDVDWGDGTAPLLSATAGEYLKGVGDQRFPGAASRHLGPGTSVETVTLGPPYPHSAMLNDPEVREKLKRIYIEQNTLAGRDPSLGAPGEVVNSLSIEFFLKTAVSGQGHSIILSSPGEESKPKPSFVSGSSVEIPFGKLLIQDARVHIPKVYAKAEQRGILRPLRITDFPTFKPLELQKGRGPTLEFTGYRVIVNGKESCASNKSFTLNVNFQPISLQCK